MDSRHGDSNAESSGVSTAGKGCIGRDPRELIDWPELISRCGNEDVATAIVQVWREDNPELIQQLGKAIKGSDPKAMSGYAHQIKGSAATIGARALATMATQLESNDTPPSQEDVLEQFEALEEMCAEIMAFLERPNWLEVLKSRS